MNDLVFYTGNGHATCKICGMDHEIKYLEADICKLGLLDAQIERNRIFELPFWIAPNFALFTAFACFIAFLLITAESFNLFKYAFINAGLAIFESFDVTKEEAFLYIALSLSVTILIISIICELFAGILRIWLIKKRKEHFKKKQEKKFKLLQKAKNADLIDEAFEKRR